MSDQDEGGGVAGPNVPQTQMTPRSSLGSGSGSSISPSTSSSGSINSAKAAVSECLGAWLNYLNSLNNLCASGYRLSQTISNLDQWLYVETAAPTLNPGLHAQSAWDDLARASAVATSTVKSHVVAVLQEYVTQPLNTLDPDIDLHRIRDHNQGIITEVAQTMINLQHQFCVASYDSFAHLMYSQQQQQQQQMQLLEANDYPPSHHNMMMKLGHSSAGDGGSRSRNTSPHFHHHAAHRSVYGSEHNSSTGLEQPTQPRGASPQDIRGPSPIQGFLDNVRGPLPNPGHLMGMKTPFYRGVGSRSPLNFPLFPLAGHGRRWSEAAAGEVASGESVLDAESQMRRWSMPWEATTKTDRNSANWHQTGRIMPISKLAVPPGGGGGYSHATGGPSGAGMSTSAMSSHTRSTDRSQSTTPDSVWQSSITSQDGLAEAIQLLSCKPANRYQPPPSSQQQAMGAPFIEEPQSLADLQQLEAWNQSQQQQQPK